MTRPRDNVPTDIRKSYPNPPIVEAVVEFRFTAGKWSPEIFTRLLEQVRTSYGGLPRIQRQVELHADLTGPELKTTGTAVPQGLLIPSEDGKRVFGLNGRILSVHVLAPYPGWERFLEQVRAAFSTYVAIVAPQGLECVGVRYIDRIATPASESLSKFFTILPSRPIAMPDVLSAFHIVLQSQDEDTTAFLTLSSTESADPDRVVALYDLNLFRPVSGPLGAWEPHVDELHRRQRAIFEASITDLARDLFQ